MILFFCSVRNVLVDLKEFRCVITDLGMARHISDYSETKIFSPRWSAPELVLKRIFTTSTDIWALGNDLNIEILNSKFCCNR